MEILKIYSKLNRLNAGVALDEENMIIRLPCYGMTAYINGEFQPEIEMEYNCRRYRKNFNNIDSLYVFLSGVLSGEFTFSQVDRANIAVNGFSPVSNENLKKRRIVRAVFNMVIGLPLAVFGLLLAVVGVMFNVDYSSPSLLLELCPLPLAIGMTVAGVSMIHHGFTKKPIAKRSALAYGIGVVFISFGLMMLMVTYGETDEIALPDLIALTFMFVFCLAVGAAMVVCSLIYNGREYSEASQFIIKRIPYRLTSEEITLLIDKIKEKTVTEAIEITLAPFGNMGITDSKLGGLHYWDASMSYPKNMYFLAQFNLSQLPETKKLPREGMLQFFSDCEENCKVVYHKKIDPYFTEETALSLGIQAVTKSDIIPFEGECGFEFRLTEMFIDQFDEFSGNIVLDAARELGFEVEDDITLDELPYESDTSGHHLLGYPCFAQYDPRETDGKYNTLLFQLDSEMSERFTIVWGDFGVADFFVNDKDLEALNFDDVFFTWDSY